MCRWNERFGHWVAKRPLANSGQLLSMCPIENTSRLSFRSASAGETPAHSMATRSSSLRSSLVLLLETEACQSELIWTAVVPHAAPETILVE